MKVEFSYGDKCFELEAYKTYQEKDALIYALGDQSEDTLDKILKIFNFPANEIKHLTLDEKLAILYKYREISVGESVETDFECTNCHSISTSDVTLDIIETPEYDDYKKYFNDAYKVLTDKNFEDFLNKNVNIDDMDIDEYELLKIKIYNNICTFNFKREMNCIKCRSKNIINLRNIDFCLRCLSEDDISSFFKTYNNMVYYGHYSKLDIDSMYPYERKILNGLLIEMFKDNKNNKMM